MAAVLVPPSACRTSQSIAMVFSPNAARSMQARSDLPTKRLISCVRPDRRPFTDSRSPRVWVADGSIAYSAVSQPNPDPLRHRGTPSVTLAVHMTLVWPNPITTDPAGCDVNPRVMTTGRSSSSRRPSSRLDTPPTLARGYQVQERPTLNVSPHTTACTGPPNSALASLITSSREVHGGMWVNNNSPTPAAVAIRPASVPDRCKLGGRSGEG